MRDHKITDAFEAFAPSEEQRKKIYGSIAYGQQGTDRRRTAWVCTAAACVVLAVAAAIWLPGLAVPDNAALVETSDALGNRPSSSGGVPSAAESDAIFAGFVFTTFRSTGGAEYLNADFDEEAERLTLMPDVRVLLAKYSPAMSSVPGLPFTVGLAGDDTDISFIEAIKISVNSGGLCEWDQNTGIVTLKGQEAAFDVGKTFYWSPVDGEGAADVIYVTITVEAVAGGDTVGRQEIAITQQQPGYYYATAGELELL